MYEAVLIGVSAGGLEALKIILPALPADFPLPVVIVQHLSESSDSYLARYLNGLCKISVKEAEAGAPLIPGVACLAPPGYHLLIEPDKTFGLSVDPRVNYSCPSIDVLFESAVDVFGEKLVGVILTGANSDGSNGLRALRNAGGTAIVQDPETAHIAYMPRAALAAVKPDFIVKLEDIAPLLVRLSTLEKEDHHGTGTYR